MNTRMQWTALLIAAPLALAGCNGDDEEATGEGSETTTTQTQAETSDEQQAQVLELRNVVGQPRFEQTELQAQAGEVTLRLTSEGDVEHNIAIEDENGEQIGEAGELVANGDVSETTVELEPGLYTYYCEPHKEAGMVGTLTVT